MSSNQHKDPQDSSANAWQNEVYSDAAKPVAKQFGERASERELGKVLADLSISIVNVATHAAKTIELPTIWTYQKVAAWLQPRLQERLQDIPADRLQAPSPKVGGSIIEALRFEGQRPDLRELYLNLLATAMDKETARKAHPGFVDCLKQMTPDEARIMKLFESLAGQPIVSLYERFDNGTKMIWLRRHSHIGLNAKCELPELTSSYVDNLVRLGLLEILEGEYITDQKMYKPLELDPEVANRAKAIEAQTENKNVKPAYFVEQGLVRRTHFGALFYEACIANNNPAEKS